MNKDMFEKLGCGSCGFDYLCADVSREIDYKVLVDKKLTKCPAWKEEEGKMCLT